VIQPVLVGYLGPQGTFTHEALMADPAAGSFELRPLPTVYDTIMAVQQGRVERALVPIENSLEGSVNATLDTLAVEAGDIAIVGETVHPIRHCLISRRPLALEDIREVVSHPQATAQCARFLRARLDRATVIPATSTADAVRTVAESDRATAALGTRLSADIYGCVVLEDGVEDLAGNQTRFVWLGPQGLEPPGDGPWKTSIVFWGAGDDAPGWLVRCLSALADRDVNLTMIESRPRRLALGHYMFFADLQGHAEDPRVAEALGALRGQTEALRVLGSYPAA
jgi:prephenate dehydratase